MERQMFIAVLLAGFHQRCACGLLARYFRSVGHSNLSFLGIRKAGWVFHHLGPRMSAVSYSLRSRFCFCSQGNSLLLPGKIHFAKVAIGTHPVVVHIEEPQAVDDALRSQVVGVSHVLLNETLVLMLRTEGLNEDSDRLRHTDGVGDLNLALLCVSGKNDVPCNLTAM